MLTGKMFLGKEIVTGHCREDGIVGDGLGPAGQVIQECKCDAPAEFDIARFAVFGVVLSDVDAMFVHVHIGEDESAGLRGAQAGVE